MLDSLFGQRSRRDYGKGRRTRHVAILTLGRLGWTAREIAEALRVTPPTIHNSLAGVLLYWERRVGAQVLGSGRPLHLKLPATIRELARRESVAILTEDDVRVCDALRAMLARVPRYPPS